MSEIGMGKTNQDPPELDCQSQFGTGNKDTNSKDVVKDSSIVTEIMQLVTDFCPCLSSTEELKKSFHKVALSIKERPMSSILYGLIIMFGFIPFAGFVLLVCGSFALLFTWFVFCQFFAVIVSALVCAGVFWLMLCGFATLAVLLGGTVHAFMLWGIVARLVRRLAQKLSTFVLHHIGIPEVDSPPTPEPRKESEE